jgi:hypothetical protein
MSAQAVATWSWRPVDTAAAPRAAVAHGLCARRLHARLSQLPSDRRETLEVSAAPDWLVVMGAPDNLPWADGVRYAAPAAGEPSLWLPTHVEPDVPVDLLSRALQRHHGRQPLLLWNSPAVVFPLDAARMASDTVLAMISSTWQTSLSGESTRR